MRVLFIGTGTIAREHAGALKLLGTEIAGAADINSESAKAFAERFQTKPLNVEEELEQALHSGIDYVVLSPPPSLRVDYARRVYAAGVALMIEKPIAKSMEDALEIKRLQDKYHGRTIVNFGFRYSPSFRILEDAVKSGEMGAPILVFSERLDPHVGSGYAGKGGRTLQKTWRTDPDLACGMTIESVAHDFDMMSALVGKFTAVSANVTASNPNYPMIDNNASITLHTADGVIGNVLTSRVSALEMGRRGVICTKGAGLIQGPSPFEFREVTIKTQNMEVPVTYHTNESRWTNGPELFRHIHSAFQESLAAGTPVRTPLEDGIDALRLSLAALESSREGGRLITL